MSKEVKLGLAIGGILLSVILVYMMVVTASPPEAEQVTLELPAPTAVPDAPNSPPVAPDPVTVVPPAPEVPPATGPAVAEATQEVKNDPWVDLLAREKQMESVTPVPSQPVTLQPNVKPVPPVEISVPASPDLQRPADRPVSSVARTHTVQRGETYSSISAAAYGSAAYFAHIIRANPGVDPGKLRPGTIINLPPESQVKATSTPRAEQARTVDDRTEYRVQGSDSLYKISMKLYGKPDFVQKLYETNKAAIGADKGRLQVGMILRLPEAPMASR